MLDEMKPILKAATYSEHFRTIWPVILKMNNEMLARTHTLVGLIYASIIEEEEMQYTYLLGKLDILMDHAQEEKQ